MADAPDERTVETFSQANRRRLLFECLTEFGEPVSLPDLADEIATRESDQPLSDIPGERVKEIYLSLYHHHVTALESAGFIEYDQETDLVTVAESIDPDVDPFPEADEELK